MATIIAKYFIFIATAISSVSAQIAWTPIFVDGSSQVDLWTQSSTGCACPETGAARGCACCVREGACACGARAPARCAQCGLEQHCASMCNITIDSRVLKARSGKTFGQIKSPSLEGPGACSYLLQPDTGQRVEIQVYRLVSVGRFNGSSCTGGHLQLVDGAGAARAADTRLCGANERYTPPVVLFADHGTSTLMFQITEKTVRSQFLAYFSFTSLSNSQGVGFHPKGGSRIANTDCDWLYQDVSCRVAGACVLASPGYPGVYPPHRRCRYLLTTSSVHTRVRVTFTSILLPDKHCETDNLSLRAGGTSAAPLLATLCSERRAQLEHPGPNLLLEFNSGAQVPPFDYNGFIAQLEFVERVASAEGVTTPLVPHTIPAQPIAALMDGTVPGSTPPPAAPACGARVLAAAGLRSGHFDSRTSIWRGTCTIIFVGGQTDVVHISLFNYHLKAPSCRSVIEIADGAWEGGRGEAPRRGEPTPRPALRLCSPATREARDPSGRFVERKAVVSRGPNLTIHFRRVLPLNGEEEFVDGAFMFHDEQQQGTVRPDATCGTQHYGLSAPAFGRIGAPAHHHLYWNLEGRLACHHYFTPANNQSITIEVQSLEKLSGGACVTSCGDAGCRCDAAGTALAQYDHLAILTHDDRLLSCICGNFQSEYLPVVVRSWSGIRVEYSVAHYTYASRGFSYSAGYRFSDDAVCGQRTYTTHSGEITTDTLVADNLNSFFYQQCTWVLDSNVERQLFIEISTNQSRPCVAWNISVHEWAAAAEEAPGGGAEHAGALLHTFCPRDLHQTYSLPWRLNTVVIRVVALTRTQPLYRIKWRSQVVRANTRLGNPTPAPAASAADNHHHPTTGLFTVTTLILISMYIVKSFMSA